jgi:hypothetical protein
MKNNLFYDAVRYAFANDYRVYPVTEDNYNYRVVVERGSKKAVSSKIYTKNTIDKAIERTIFKIQENAIKSTKKQVTGNETTRWKGREQEASEENGKHGLFASG